MKKLAIAIAVSAAALLGGSAANAADGAVNAKAATVAQSTDFSSRARHYYHRHWHHSYYRPYYGSYGYYPQPYYYGGGPVVGFGFGGGGWGHHRRW
jgi:hypothetical protein